MWTAPHFQDGSRLPTRSLAIRCPACLREASSLAEMVFATPAPSTWATLVDASVTFGSSRVSTDRSFHLLCPASSWAIRRASSLVGADFGSGGHCVNRPAVDAARHHQAPGDAGELVGQRYSHQFRRLSLQKRGGHGVGLWRPLRMCRSSAVAPTIRVDRSTESPALVMPPCFCRPPVE